ARRQIRKYVVAAFIRLGGMADPGARFRNRYLHIGNRGPGRVRYGYEQSGIDSLPHEGRRKPKEYCPEQYGDAEVPQFDETDGGTQRRLTGICSVRLIPAIHPTERGSRQFFHDITPPRDSKELQTKSKENPPNAWNWFHTLTERKPPVKGEFIKPIGWTGFSTSCRRCAVP